MKIKEMQVTVEEFICNNNNLPQVNKMEELIIIIIRIMEILPYNICLMVIIVILFQVSGVLILSGLNSAMDFHLFLDRIRSKTFDFNIFFPTKKINRFLTKSRLT